MRGEGGREGDRAILDMYQGRGGGGGRCMHGWKLDVLLRRVTIDQVRLSA